LGDSQDTEQSLPDLLVDFMTSSPLLPRLAHLQSSLDPLDIGGLNALLQSQKGIDLLNVDENDFTDTLGGEVTLEEYTDFVKSYLANEAATQQHEYAKLIKSYASTETSVSEEAAPKFLNEKSSIRNLVIGYLLSASFKDCSIMIKITQDPLSESSEKKLEAYLVDVDVKSIKRLVRYAKLDRELMSSFELFRDKGGEMNSCKV
jgi:inositol-pentakisphosphate 2-kinase